MGRLLTCPEKDISSEKEKCPFFCPKPYFVPAIFNGSAKGGTAYTVNYALEKKRAAIIIDPDTLHVLPYTINLNK